MRWGGNRGEGVGFQPGRGEGGAVRGCPREQSVARELHGQGRGHAMPVSCALSAMSTMWERLLWQGMQARATGTHLCLAG